MKVNSKLKVPTTLDLIRSIPTIKREWKSMSPIQKWCYLFGIGKFGFVTIKFPTFSDNVADVHWFAYYCWTYTGTFLVLMLYTFYYYLSRGDFYSCLPCTCMAGVLAATSPMAINYIFKNRFMMDSLGRFGGLHIYQDNDFEDTEYNQISSNHMDKTMKSLLFKMAMMTFSAIVACIGPVHAYFVHGIKTTTWEVRIPLTDPKSDAEFITNVLMHFNLVLHGFFGYVGMEVWMALVENTVIVGPALFKLEMERLCKGWKNKSISELEMRLKFNNLIQQSLDADNYVSHLSKMLYIRTFITPVIFTLTIAMGIFCQYKMGFAAGYGIAFMSWVQLFFVCELGENTQDNGFTEILYNTEWEILPLNYQKVLMLVINRKQNVS